MNERFRPAGGPERYYRRKSPAKANVTSKEMLDVFAKTGHETLRALLFISAGSVVVLLPFFGSIICSDRFILANHTGLASSFRTFIYSLVFCLACYGAAFASHGCYYRRWQKWGTSLTMLAIALGLISITLIARGGQQGYEGLRSLTQKPDPPAAAASALQNTGEVSLKPDPALAPSEGTNQRGPGIAPVSPR